MTDDAPDVQPKLPRRQPPRPENPPADLSSAQRVEWALDKFGPDAPYYWITFKIQPDGKVQSAVARTNGIGYDEAAIGRQCGAGRYRRQLRVIGVQGVTITTDEFDVSPAPAAGAAIVGDVIPAGSGNYPPPPQFAAGYPPYHYPPPPDRLSRLESMVERLADRLAGAVGAGVGAPQPALGGLSVKDFIELSQRRTPMEDLLSLKRLSREMWAERRDSRDDEDDEDDGGGVAGVVERIVGQVVKSMSTQGTPAGATMQAPSVDRPSPPAPVAAAIPAHAGTAGAPAAPTQAEPFPGARAIAEFLIGNPAVVATFGGDAAAVDTAADLLAQTIEEAFGSPIIVAEKLGLRVLDAMIGYAPALEPHRAALAPVVARFVAVQTEGDE